MFGSAFNISYNILSISSCHYLHGKLALIIKYFDTITNTAKFNCVRGFCRAVLLNLNIKSQILCFQHSTLGLEFCIVFVKIQTATDHYNLVSDLESSQMHKVISMMQDIIITMHNNYITGNIVNPEKP